MKRKPKVDADLDPRNQRHSRPGEKAADAALADSRRTAGGRAGARKPPSRPGATAAARAVAAARTKGRSRPK